jgi:chemotaxis protein MotB
VNKKKPGSQGPQIVIRRVYKVEGGHQGGTWKIAEADFVTALMAFFLLMWLLGSTTKGDLKGISDYFKTPMSVAMLGGTGTGTATSVIQGGGKDLSRSDAGEVHKGETREDPLKPNVTAEQKKEDKARLEALRSRLHAFIQATPYLEPFRDQIRLDITREGLLIQITDEKNRPMFDSGSTVLKDYTRNLLASMGRMLNEVENKVSVAGHTDAKPYSGDQRGYSNWELSSERANAARRELVVGGMQQSKVLQMRGLADAQPLFEEDPLHPANRRISILVLNKESEHNFYQEGKAEAQ